MRQALRNAKNTKASYIIQVGAEQLAQRRVESATLNLRAGRASTRDVLEAQEALVDAQNTKTSALIDFTLARLDLYLELEILRVDETGIRVDDELTQRLIGASSGDSQANPLDDSAENSSEDPTDDSSGN